MSHALEVSGGEVGELAPRVVVVENLSKTFRIPHRQYSTLKERALHPLSARTFDELHALRDVSFKVGAGEFFGIVGRNGSGKSTLLKCLAQIYRPDRGVARIRGRLSPFIELGVGFNQDLTARENVTINAILLGLTRREARASFDRIIEFAELEDFVDLKLKNYSSGMQVRLAFSVAIQAYADVLLIDEVLAVGDAAFQQKCFEQFEQMKAEGKTIVLVTHDMYAVERFCHRALLIEKGELLEIGSPQRIARRYNELNFGRMIHAASESDRYGDRSDGEVKDAWFENSAGERITSAAQGDRIQLAMEVEFHATVVEPTFAFALTNEPGHTVFATTTEWLGEQTGTFGRSDRAVVRVAIDNWLVPMRYTLTPSIARHGSGADAIDMREALASLVIHGTRTTGGLIDPPHSFEITRP